MKRLLLIVFYFYAWATISGQSVGLGLRDNQYIHACYINQHKWLIGYEQSLLNVRIKEQSGRIFAGYIFEKDMWTIMGITYGGIEYAGNWQAGGAIVKGGMIKKRMSIGATFNINYDSYFDVQLNYDIDVHFAILRKITENLDKKQLDFCVSWGNLPEYRDNIKYLRVGMRFMNNNLWIQPEFCMPHILNRSSNYLRVLCSFGWIWNFK